MKHSWKSVQSHTDWEWNTYCLHCGGEYPGDSNEFPERQFPCLNWIERFLIRILNLRWRLSCTRSRQPAMKPSPEWNLGARP